MAKLAATLTALFLFFAFTHARTPFDLPENDVIVHDPSSSLREADAKPTLLLPSEKTDAEIAVADAEIAVTDAEDLPEAETRTVDALPLTIVRFRPVNRHFPSMRAYPFRIALRRCRHGMKPMMNPRAYGGKLSYGNDMILAGESASKGFDPEMFRGGERHIPARWERFHNHHYRHHGEGMPGFPFDRHHDMFPQQRFGKPFHREDREEEEEEREDGGGFISGFRKFLNQFEF